MIRFRSIRNGRITRATKNTRRPLFIHYSTFPMVNVAQNKNTRQPRHVVWRGWASLHTPKMTQDVAGESNELKILARSCEADAFGKAHLQGRKV